MKFKDKNGMILIPTNKDIENLFLKSKEYSLVKEEKGKTKKGENK